MEASLASSIASTQDSLGVSQCHVLGVTPQLFQPQSVRLTLSQGPKPKALHSAKLRRIKDARLMMVKLNHLLSLIRRVETRRYRSDLLSLYGTLQRSIISYRRAVDRVTVQ